jgi:hypothetical protein
MPSKYKIMVEAEQSRLEADRLMKPIRLASQKAKQANPGVIPPWEGESSWPEAKGDPDDTDT